MDRHIIDAFVQSLADALVERLSQSPLLKPPVKAGNRSPETQQEAPAEKAEGLSDYVSAKEAARLLDVSMKTLERLRAKGEGPRFKKLGGVYRYRRDDL
jgi:hypothetical protein